MKENKNNKILILETNLFPDRKTLDSALQSIGSSNMRTVIIVPDKMDKSAWANVLKEILSADMLLAL
jgi:hypothetical protein